MNIPSQSEFSFPYKLQDVFAAGTETSAATVDWAMSEMVRYPRVMDKAQAEVRHMLKGKDTVLVQESDLKELNYLKLVKRR